MTEIKNHIYSIPRQGFPPPFNMGGGEPCLGIEYEVVVLADRGQGCCLPPTASALPPFTSVPQAFVPLPLVFPLHRLCPCAPQGD